MSVIEINNLHYKSLFENITFEFEQNKYTTIIGRNGSGKSTILKLLLGLVKPSYGSVSICNNKYSYDDSNYDNTIRKNIGAVFQNFEYQIIGYTVKEDLLFGMKNLQFEENYINDQIEKYIQKFYMLPSIDYETSMLSMRNKQILTLASSLITERKIILLDEYTSEVDRDTAKILQNILLDEVKINYRTVISITHDYNEVINSDCVVFIEGNKFHNLGNPNTFSNETLSFLEETCI